MKGLNTNAWSLVEEMIEKEDELKIHCQSIAKATVLDTGITVPGSEQAGLIVTKITMGGYGSLAIQEEKPVPSCLGTISVKLTEHPALATLGAQFAGWRISKKYQKTTSKGTKEKKYFAMGSGPARALPQEPKEIYQALNYTKEESDRAVLLLETGKLPPPEIVEYIARKCKIEPSNLALICAPTNSLVGSIQIAGRVVETGIHKIKEVGLDPKIIKEASGTAPIAPVAPDAIAAMGITNDAIIFGGYVHLVLEERYPRIEELVKKTPSSYSKDYGKPFQKIFEEAEFDFFKIDEGLFAPAKIRVTIGETELEAGNLDWSRLNESFHAATPIKEI
ncbi:MAG: methenyltetrahydromethanopterin cyclohydrolase [Promethearchaeota archaeon]